MNFIASEREIDRMRRRLTGSTTKTIARARNLLILQLKQDNWSMTSQSSSPGSMISTNWSTPRPMIWRTRRLNSLTVKERSFSSRIKSSASKMSSTILRASRRNTEMRTKTSKEESTKSPLETWSLLPPSRNSRPRSEQRRTRLCT